MESPLEGNRDPLSTKQEKLSTRQMGLEEVDKLLHRYDQNIFLMHRRIKELENKSDEDNSRFAKMLEDRDNTINALMSEKEKLMNERPDCMDTKVTLDSEIAMYRNLLERGEKMLGSSHLQAGGGTSAGEHCATLLGDGDTNTKKRRFEEIESSTGAAEMARRKIQSLDNKGDEAQRDRCIVC